MVSKTVSFISQECIGLNIENIKQCEVHFVFLVGCRPSPPPLSLSFKHKERNIKKEPPTEFTMATFSWNSPSELWITTPCLIAFEKNWKRNQLIKNQSLKATSFFIVLIFESSWIVEFSIVSQFSISFKLCYVQNWNH